jgi:anti-sigma-K factor RskA
VVDAMSHAELEQLAAGYVLGALEPDDDHAFRRHLSGCAACQAEVRELEAVVGELAWSAPQVDPPRSLRTAIRRSVGVPAGRGARTFRLGPPRTILSRVAVALGVVLLFVLSFWNMGLRNQVALDQRRLEAFEAAARLVNDPQAETFTLTGPDGARGVVVASTLRDRGALIVQGLPALPPDRVWQLWAIPPGGGLNQAIPGRTWLSSDEVAAIPFDGMRLEPQTTFAVTSEPRGGSRRPSPPLVLRTQTER